MSTSGYLFGHPIVNQARPTYTMAIELSPDTTKRLIASIQRYFADELDQDIGDLKARMVLDYCVREIGPSIYNKGVADAQAYLARQVADLESACYEKEFGYWKR